MRDKTAQLEQLARTWELMAAAVEKTLQAESPSASSMDVARRWLASNGANLDTIRSWRMGNGLGFAPASLPTFNDDDDEDDEEPSDALKVIAPFATTE